MDSLNLTPLDRAWANYMEMEAEWLEAEEAANACIGKDGQLKGATWEEFVQLNADALKHMRMKFSAFDTWNMLRKRAADTTLSNVPESDVKSLVTEALSESGADLQFSLNLGLVAHKLTGAVLRFTVREEGQSTPLCLACR